MKRFFCFFIRLYSTIFLFKTSYSTLISTEDAAIPFPVVAFN